MSNPDDPSGVSSYRPGDGPPDPILTFFGPVGVQRSLWNPKVHEAFNERCYFYLMSGRDSLGDTMVQRVSELFEALGISSGSFNVVLGPYDLLIRVWLTPRRRDRMLRLLQGSRSGVDLDTILEFSAQDVYYTWPLTGETQWKDSGDLRIGPSRLPELDDDERHAAEIVAHAGAIDFGHKIVDRAALRDAFELLSSRDLIVPFTPPRGIKVCLFITSDVAAVRDSGEDAAFIAWEMKESRFLGVSVSAGEGFCDYLAKGVVRSYQEALPAIERLQHRIAVRGLHGWSLAPADYGERSEGETLDAGSPVGSQLAHSLLGLDSSAPARVPEILDSPGSEENVREFSAWLAENLAPGEQERLLEITRAGLASDRPAFNQRMSYLIGIEADLRAAIPMIARRYSREPENWREEFEAMFSRQISDAADRAARTRFEWKFLDVARLHDLFAYLRTLVANSEDAKVIVESSIGESWTQVWPNVVTLRDDFAHGRLLEDAIGQEFDREWWLRLRAIGQSIVIQRGLESLVKNLSENVDF